MPVDPYLWRITEQDRGLLEAARRMRARGFLSDDASELAVLTSRQIRRRTREWQRIDRELWHELGYEDRGGEG